MKYIIKVSEIKIDPNDQKQYPRTEDVYTQIVEDLNVNELASFVNGTYQPKK